MRDLVDVAKVQIAAERMAHEMHGGVRESIRWIKRREFETA